MFCECLFHVVGKTCIFIDSNSEYAKIYFVGEQLANGLTRTQVPLNLRNHLKEHSGEKSGSIELATPTQPCSVLLNLFCETRTQVFCKDTGSIEDGSKCYTLCFYEVSD